MFNLNYLNKDIAMKKISLILLSIAYAWQGIAFSDTEKTNTKFLLPYDKSQLMQVASEQIQENAEAERNECWSAKNCTGKILNNKDAHNFKLSGGKSWRSRATGQCFNL